MSKLPFRDMMRVRVCDVDGRLIRVLDLKVAHDVVLQGSTWRPGVVLSDEGDLEAMEICGAINELGFERDADGVPVGAHGELEDGGDVRWAAERVPIGTPRPTLEEWSGEPGRNL
jgi:hypothetical protein